MSIKLELEGIVYRTGQPTTTPGGYVKQDMILHVPNIEQDKWSDHFPIEWNSKNLEKVSDAGIKDGDRVKIEGYLSGNKWQKATEDFERAFAKISGFNIQKVEEEQTSDDLTPFPVLDKEQEEVQGDLPF